MESLFSLFSLLLSNFTHCFKCLMFKNPLNSVHVLINSYMTFENRTEHLIMQSSGA